jgi:cytochrome c oxidase assembly protein subunit 15
MIRLSTILVILTFLLIFMGGQVTTTDSGDSVPSWPASFFWPKGMAQWWELGHRWFAGAVGLVAIGLAVWVLRSERNPLARKLAVAAAVLVVIQAIVGGVRVLTVEKHVKAVVHALLAQAFLAIVVALATVLRRQPAPVLHGPEHARWPWRRASALAVVTWIQAGLGAVLRHETRDKNPWGLALHLGGAMLVIVFAVRLVVPIQEHLKHDPRFLRPARWIAAAIFGQLALGLGAWTTTHTSTGYVNPTDVSSLVPTLHLVLGSAILSLAVMIAMRGRTTAPAPS